MLSTRSPRRRLALAAGALALLAVAPAARATIPATVTDYSVDAELTAHYEQHVQPPDGVGEFASSFTISELLPKVTFTDHGLTSSGTASTTVSSVESSAYMETHTPSGTVSATCTGNQTEPIMGPNIHSPLVGALGEESLVLRPFEDLILLWTCTGPSTFPSALLLPNVEEPNGEAPFNVVFTLPDEATSSGKVIQLVNKDVPFDKCPLRNASTTTCTLHLQGQITFVRTGQRTVQVEAQPVDPTDIQPVPLVPPMKDDDLLEPLVRKAKLAGDGTATTFTFTCGAGCTLTARVYTGGGGPRAAAAGAPLATKRVTLAHGGTRKVTLRFGKAARRAIKRAGGARLDLSVKPLAGGTAVHRTVILRLGRR